MTCKDCIKFDTCYRCHNFDRFGDLVTSVYFEESAEECKEFKNKNNIINLPCKFGDTLYWIQEEEIKEFKVTGYVGVYEDGSYCINGEDYRLEEFGKEVFLTREEAEKSIEENYCKNCIHKDVCCITEISTCTHKKSSLEVITLPCKLGTTVYAVKTVPDLYCLSGNSLEVVVRQSNFSIDDIKKFGDTVFLTDKEAQEKAEEMRERIREASRCLAKTGKSWTMMN